jgi:tyrosyl-tRNA synthetase
MSSSSPTPKALDVICHNLAEIIDPDAIIPKILESSIPLRIYWGTATTGKPHLGYLVPLIKIVQFMSVGVDLTILLADLHAMLDSLKSSAELITARTDFYRFILTVIIQRIREMIGVGVGTGNGKGEGNEPSIVVGSSFQKSPEYTMDLFKLMSVTSCKNAQRAGAEVVKQSKDPLLSSMVYPLMQCLDEVYLKCDVQFGGVDQRKLFMFSRDSISQIGYNKCAYLMNPLIPGLTKTGKMSSSEPNSKIDFDDSDEVIREKFMKAFSVEGQVENNGLLAITKYIIFELFPTGITVTREEKYGGNVTYATYKALEDDFAAGKLASADLKPTLSRLVIDIISPIRQALQSNADLVTRAYGTTN